MIRDYDIFWPGLWRWTILKGPMMTFGLWHLRFENVPRQNPCGFWHGNRLVIIRKCSKSHFTFFQSHFSANPRVQKLQSQPFYNWDLLKQIPLLAWIRMPVMKIVTSKSGKVNSPSFKVISILLVSKSTSGNACKVNYFLSKSFLCQSESEKASKPTPLQLGLVKIACLNSHAGRHVQSGRIMILGDLCSPLKNGPT